MLRAHLELRQFATVRTTLEQAIDVRRRDVRRTMIPAIRAISRLWYPAKTHPVDCQ
jgi:hypothetical protein